MTPIEVYTQVQAVYEEIGLIEDKIHLIKTNNASILTNTQLLTFTAVTAQLVALESSLHDLYDEITELLLKELPSPKDKKH